MKFLALLEKNKAVWWVIGLGLFFFLLRLPSTIEPFWYGDEGIYEVIGIALNQGHILYTDIWDNKPPLLYVVYALANGDQLTVRILSLMAGVLSASVFFFLSKKIFNSFKITIFTTLLFTLLFATPLIEGNIANAENFILLPIITAALLLYQTTKKSFLLPLAGLLLGIAFLFKIVAIFDFAAFFLFLSFLKISTFNYKQILSTLKQLLPLLFGFVLPFFISIVYFAIFGSLEDFIHAAFFGNVNYVSFENDLFTIPHGLLFVKIAFLLLAVSLVFIKRKSFSRPVLFITLWGIFAFFSTFFSGRPYIHYLLMLLPSLCLLIGLLCTVRRAKLRFLLSLAVLGLCIFFYIYFGLNAQRTIESYQNTFLYVTNQKSLTAYQSFFDSKVPRDYAVSSFIQSRTSPDDEVFIWGDNAQIYALSHKLPPGKYTTAYHIIPNQAAIEETQRALDLEQPKYIITLSETQPLPFRLPLYIMRFTMEGAAIYERSF